MRLDKEVVGLIYRDDEHNQHSFDALVRLLAFLRRKAPEYFDTNGYRWELGADAAAERVGLENVLRHKVYNDKGKLRDTFTDQVLRDWAATVKVGNLSSAEQARLFAVALHDLYQARFRDDLVNFYKKSRIQHPDGGYLVNADDPLPSCNPLFAPDPQVSETHPRRLPRWRTPDRTRTICLAPKRLAADDIQLIVRFDFEDCLDGVGDNFKLATIHTMSDISDLKPNFDSKHERFGPVSSINDTENRRRLVAAVRRAVAEGASLIVIPELATTAAGREAVRKAWRQEVLRSKKASILVAGSAHTASKPGEANQNEGYVFGISSKGTETAARLTKNVPYIHRVKVAEVPKIIKGYRPPPDAAPGEKVEFVEKISYKSKPEVVLFYGQNASLGVLICVDFLDEGLRDILRDTDTSIVAIPAMTFKLRVFEGLITGHAADTQALVVLANALIGGHHEGNRNAPPLSRGYVRRNGYTPEFWRIGPGDHAFEDSLKSHGIALFELPQGNAKWINLGAPTLPSPPKRSRKS